MFQKGWIRNKRFFHIPNAVFISVFWSVTLWDRSDLWILTLDPGAGSGSCLLHSLGTFTSVFKENISLRSHKTVKIKVFLNILFLLVDGRIRIRIYHYGSGSVPWVSKNFQIRNIVLFASSKTWLVIVLFASLKTWLVWRKLKCCANLWEEGDGPYGKFELMQIPARSVRSYSILPMTWTWNWIVFQVWRMKGYL